MKRIILGLLLAAISFPAQGQTNRQAWDSLLQPDPPLSPQYATTEQAYLLGKKKANFTCAAIWQGATTKDAIIRTFSNKFNKQETLLDNLVIKLAQQSNGDHKMFRAANNGFLDGINPCYDEYVKLFGYP